MDNFKVNYYFNFIDEFEHKAIFDNTTYAWDVLANVKPYIQEKVEKDNVQINNAAEVADFPRTESPTKARDATFALLNSTECLISEP